MRMVRLLVVEDFANLRLPLIQGLEAEGYAVDGAAEGDQAWWLIRHNTYDLAILDIMMPGIDGLEILRRMRADANETPVLLLTAKGTVEDRVHGLDLGADDYLTKPFSVDELLARIRVLTRRRSGRRNPRMTIADLVVDTTTRTASRGGTALELTPREYALLELLAGHAGEVVSRDAICASLYAFQDDVVSNVVEAAVARLRRKLSPQGQPPLVHTRRGFGYVLAAEDPA